MNEFIYNHKIESLNINELETIELTCTNHSFLQENIWTFNENLNIEFKQNNAILKINALNLNQSGIYECLSVTNDGNYLTTYNLFVNLTYQNSIKKLVQGKSVILDCDNILDTDTFKMEKNNKFVRWTLNGLDLITDNIKRTFLDKEKTSLTIYNLSLNETKDIYSCFFDSKLIISYTLLIGGDCLLNFF